MTKNKSTSEEKFLTSSKESDEKIREENVPALDNSDNGTKTLRINNLKKVEQMCEENFMNVNKALNIFTEVGIRTFFSKTGEIKNSFKVIRRKGLQSKNEYAFFPLANSVLAMILEHPHYEDMIALLSDIEQEEGIFINLPDFISEILTQSLNDKSTKKKIVNSFKNRE